MEIQKFKQYLLKAEKTGEQFIESLKTGKASKESIEYITTRHKAFSTLCHYIHNDSINQHNLLSLAASYHIGTEYELLDYVSLFEIFYDRRTGKWDCNNLNDIEVILGNLNDKINNR